MKWNILKERSDRFQLDVDVTRLKRDDSQQASLFLSSSSSRELKMKNEILMNHLRTVCTISQVEIRDKNICVHLD
jgi:hypothetical protein